ncbi:unnamed protein product [Amoebophrya sp. A25]|nr:unnamed protein product [Amoebophrya sp. A25]|eukprot:GSA25T00013615001.1
MPPKKAKVILDRFEVIEGKKGFLGQGSFSSVQRGTDLQTGRTVAIKTFKMDVWNRDPKKNLAQFKKQIDIINRLLEPVDPSKIKYEFLKHPLFWQVDPRKAFLEMHAYSVDAQGNPGVDPVDGVVYLITEKADYSMKDLVEEHQKSGERFTPETVAQISKAMIISMGILHAKNLTHLDMKPENIMRSGDTWKLIDVDGCTEIDYKLYPGDSSVAFSPIYCSPEWANFCVDPPGEYLPIADKLDVWSTGASLAELVMLDVLFKGVFKEIHRTCGDPGQTQFQFLNWLANPANKVPFPEVIMEFHPLYVDLVVNNMMNKRPSGRPSMAQCMHHDFIRDVEVPGLDVPMNGAAGEDPAHLGGMMSQTIKKKREQRLMADRDEKPPMMQGVLYKLNSDGDLMTAAHWLKRDFWLSDKGNLCYYSHKEGKRLILLDRAHLSTANISPLQPGESCMQFAFLVDSITSGTEHERHFFAVDTPEEYQQWGGVLEYVVQNPLVTGALDPAFKAQLGIYKDFKELRMMIRNRRDKTTNKDDFRPVYEAMLWKLNQEGDPHKDQDWNQRRMWLAKNGSFCYHSAKENKDLMYYRPDDVRHLKFRRLFPEESSRRFSFELTPSPLDGTEYAPGVFAAEEEQVMLIILGCIERYQRIKQEKEKRKRS